MDSETPLVTVGQDSLIYFQQPSLELEMPIMPWIGPERHLAPASLSYLLRNPTRTPSQSLYGFIIS